MSIKVFRIFEITKDFNSFLLFPGHFFVEGLLGVVIVILLTRKSYKPPKRPLTEQVLSQILSSYWFDRS